MKYSKVGFRKVYKKFCLFDMNDTFRKAMSDFPGVKEAKAYLEHPVLGKNIREISELLTTIEQSNASIVFGYPDDLKLRSSMTLFAEAAETDEDRNIFLKVLDKFSDGKKDTRTLEILKQIGE